MSFGKKGLTEFNVDAALNGNAILPQREERVHRLMKVTLFHERFGSVDAVVRDISSGGLGGRCAAPLAPGDVVEIDRPGFGRFQAEVRWVRNGQFGARLTSDLRIDTQEVQNLSFNNANWDTKVNKPLEHHVFTRFKPVKTAYRPPVSMLRRDK